MELNTVTDPKRSPRLFGKDLRKISEWGTGMLIIIPAVLIIVVVFLVPFVSSLISSFQAKGVFSLDNCRMI